MSLTVDRLLLSESAMAMKKLILPLYSRINSEKITLPAALDRPDQYRLSAQCVNCFVPAKWVIFGAGEDEHHKDEDEEGGCLNETVPQFVSLTSFDFWPCYWANFLRWRMRTCGPKYADRFWCPWPNFMFNDKLKPFPSRFCRYIPIWWAHSVHVETSCAQEAGEG